MTDDYSAFLEKLKQQQEDNLSRVLPTWAEITSPGFDAGTSCLSNLDCYYDYKYLLQGIYHGAVDKFGSGFMDEDTL